MVSGLEPEDFARRELEWSGIQPGDVYVHHSGYECAIVCLAIDDLCLPMVVYKETKRDVVRIRPLSHFHGGEKKFEKQNGK